jgi:lysozyme
MNVSAKGRIAICHHEGVRKKPYLDSVLLWTTGVGHLIATPEQLRMTLDERKAAKANGTLICPIEWNRKLSDDEVDAILQADLQRFERGVLRYCPAGITQGRFDALVSFSFNVGLGTLQRSTLRQKHNRGDYDGAADEFLKYCKAAGKVLKGLLNRRKDERAMYLM